LNSGMRCIHELVLKLQADLDVLSKRVDQWTAKLARIPLLRKSSHLKTLLVDQKVCTQLMHCVGRVKFGLHMPAGNCKDGDILQECLLANCVDKYKQEVNNCDASALFNTFKRGTHYYFLREEDTSLWNRDVATQFAKEDNWQYGKIFLKQYFMMFESMYLLWSSVQEWATRICAPYPADSPILQKKKALCDAADAKKVRLALEFFQQLVVQQSEKASEMFSVTREAVENIRKSFEKEINENPVEATNCYMKFNRLWNACLHEGNYRLCGLEAEKRLCRRVHGIVEWKPLLDKFKKFTDLLSKRKVTFPPYQDVGVLAISGSYAGKKTTWEKDPTAWTKDKTPVCLLPTKYKDPRKGLKLGIQCCYDNQTDFGPKTFEAQRKPCRKPTCEEACWSLWEPSWWEERPTISGFSLPRGMRNMQECAEGAEMGPAEVEPIHFRNCEIETGMKENPNITDLKECYLRVENAEKKEEKWEAHGGCYNKKSEYMSLCEHSCVGGIDWLTQRMRSPGNSKIFPKIRENSCAAACKMGDYQDALEHCSKWGRRLCSAEELKSGLGEGTGCGFDAHLMWSSTACADW